MRHTTVWMTTALIFSGSNVLAQDLGDRVENYVDQRGDRIEQRLDRQGDRIDARLDARSDRAADAGRDVAADRLDTHGDRIDQGLDRVGTTTDRRLDCRGRKADRRQRQNRTRPERRNPSS